MFRRSSSMQKISIWLITIGLAWIFMAAGLAKLEWQPEMLDNFRRWGYADWFVQLVGLGEVTAALLLLLPKTAPIAAGLLAALMLGGLATHLWWYQYEEALAPLLLGTLSLLLMALRRRQAAA